LQQIRTYIVLRMGNLDFKLNSNDKFHPTHEFSVENFDTFRIRSKFTPNSSVGLDIGTEYRLLGTLTSTRTTQVATGGSDFRSTQEGRESTMASTLTLPSFQAFNEADICETGDPSQPNPRRFLCNHNWFRHFTGQNLEVPKFLYTIINQGKQMCEQIHL